METKIKKLKTIITLKENKKMWIEDDEYIAIDLHGMRTFEAEKNLDNAIAMQTVLNIKGFAFCHGFNRGVALKTMIWDKCAKDSRVVRLWCKDKNPGMTYVDLNPSPFMQAA